MFIVCGLPNTKLIVVMWCLILIGSLQRHLVAIFANNCCCGRPVGKIRNFEKLLVRLSNYKYWPCLPPNQTRQFQSNGGTGRRYSCFQSHNKVIGLLALEVVTSSTSKFLTATAPGLHLLGVVTSVSNLQVPHYQLQGLPALGGLWQGLWPQVPHYQCHRDQSRNQESSWP